MKKLTRSASCRGWRESGGVIILLHDFPISMSPNEGTEEGRENRSVRIRERERDGCGEVVLGARLPDGKI